MVASIIIGVLIAGYCIFIIYKIVKQRKEAKKSGVPSGCSCCASYKSGSCIYNGKCEEKE